MRGLKKVLEMRFVARAFVASASMETESVAGTCIPSMPLKWDEMESAEARKGPIRLARKCPVRRATNMRRVT